MVSISTSFAGTSALRALQATSKAMAESQTRIATGYKINQASDDPHAWAAASQLRSTIKTNAEAKTNLSEAMTQAKLTTNALSQIDEGLRAIRTKVDEWVLARDNLNTSQQAAIVNEISNLQNDVKQSVASAKFNKGNWLTIGANTAITVSTGTNAQITVTTGASKIAGASSLLEIEDIGLSGSQESLVSFGAAQLDNSYRTDLTTKLTAAIEAVGSAQTVFGAATESIENRSKFLSNMNDILSTQLSSLVDADLDEESAKLAALQVKQQLATTALQIINQSQLNILRLFQ